MRTRFARDSGDVGSKYIERELYSQFDLLKRRLWNLLF